MNWNDLNVFKYGYMSKYPSQWLENIKLFFKRFKWAYQRIVKGYCDFDLWDLYTFYGCLFSNSLKEFGDSSCGYPASLTYDEWIKLINEAADHFANSLDINDTTELAILEDIAFEEMCSYIDHHESERTEDGLIRSIHIYKDEEKYNAAKDRWTAIRKELSDFRVSEKDKGFEFLKDHYFELWD